MNIKKLRGVIERYKLHFKDIHREEIYKWRAVQCFQDEWDIDAADFAAMLDRSLSAAKNLLGSSNYYPKRMILKVAEEDPEGVRALFRQLHDEDMDIRGRVTAFRREIKQLCRAKFPDLLNSYQDERAVLVYLCLRFPDRYYFYKYEMFRAFARLVEYPYEAWVGKPENVPQFLAMCSLIREELARDKNLIALHKARIPKDGYSDPNLNILTQDVVYAAVRHLDRFEHSVDQAGPLKRLRKANITVAARPSAPVLRGAFINFVENERERKRIGDLGELLVFAREEAKLKALGSSKRPVHVSKSQGDGLGYDIQSYDDKGSEILIEVKTTTSDVDAPLFITEHELECSRINRDKFVLYRVFNYDETEDTADFLERRGPLDGLCSNPVLYRAVLKRQS